MSFDSTVRVSSMNEPACLQQFYSYEKGYRSCFTKIIKDVLSQFTKNKIGISCYSKKGEDFSVELNSNNN